MKTTLRPGWAKVPTVFVVVAYANLTIALGSCAPVSSTALTFAGPCAAHVVDSAIPSWARGGFSDPNRHMHFEVGRGGKIVALLWAYPLLSPPPTTHDNKILWVSHIQTNGSTLSRRAAHDGLQAGWPGGGPACRGWSGTLDHRLTSIWLLAARSSVVG